MRLRVLSMSLVVASLATAPPASAQVSGAAGGAGAVGKAASPLVTAAELEAHVDYLSSDALAGRRAGTPGAERAALYVVRAFEAAGLYAPAKHPTYLQTFEFPVGVELGPDSRLVLQHGSRLVTIFQPGRDFIPLSGSAADLLVQSVVFAGYGISAPALGYDDYAGLDVKGRIVLVLRHGPEGDSPGGRFGRYLSERHKAATARAHGARAILFVNGPATERIDRLLPFGVDEEPGSMGIVAISITQAVALRIARVGGGDLADWQRAIDRDLEPQSRLIENAVLNLRADLEPQTRTTHNVIGIVAGRDPALAGEAVVIGAHYDGLGLGGPGSLDPVPGEIHNGADDNASGVAALIELAQFFAYPTNRPDRTLVFVAFGAEEEGMLGSALFVAQPTVPVPEIAAMINLDMIGRLEDELVIYGVGSSPAWPELIAAANREVGLPIELMPEGYGPSDHAAFYLRQVPVLAFFTGVHEDYHRASDDAEHLNIGGIERITALVRHVVARLANGVERPVFDPRQYEPRDVAPDPVEDLASGVRLGAVPRPGAPRMGVRIERVVEGSPAAAAGVRPGDRVVRLGGRSTDSIYDYVRALAELAPGRPARLIVERDGRPVSLSVIPEAAPVPRAPAETLVRPRGDS
ncbi:MAG TPA: M20/M25/M40 family metallo-hydrolase [Gemmatimonadota bacterium]|nr:M20/M25/M40 family metallo-hydrolase [Gemmatimonadota bacterium]